MDIRPQGGESAPSSGRERSRLVDEFTARGVDVPRTAVRQRDTAQTMSPSFRSLAKHAILTMLSRLARNRPKTHLAMRTLLFFNKYSRVNWN